MNPNQTASKVEAKKASFSDHLCYLCAFVRVC